jgi:hypothetical protein
VFIAGIILVDAGKKDKLLKKLKKELGYDLKKMMKQVCNWCNISFYILITLFLFKNLNIRSKKELKRIAMILLLGIKRKRVVPRNQPLLVLLTLPR